MSFPRYPRYKESGVEWLGEVPKHWGVLPLYSSMVKRSESNKGMIEDNLLSLSYGNIVKKNIKSNDGLLPESFETYQIVRRGDIVFRLTDLQNDKRSLRSAIVEETGIITSAYLAVVPLHSDSRYMGYLFRAYDVAKVFYSMGGGLRQSMKFSDLKRMPTLLPPSPEQIAIAAFLDRETTKIDKLVTEQRRLMELLKEKRQAVISHAVTKGLNPAAPMKPSGNLWLGDVPTHWSVKRLKHVKGRDKNAFVDGPFGSNLKSEHFVEGGDVYVIESGFATQGRININELKTITTAHFNTISRSEAHHGDIILAKIGAQFGKSSILPKLDKRAVVSGNSLKLSIDTSVCDVKFVQWYLTVLKELGVMDDIVNATAQPALSLGELNNLPMLVPAHLEQEEIVHSIERRLVEFDILTAETQHAIDLLQERRTALISAAVTGQIDVRGLVPNTVEAA